MLRSSNPTRRFAGRLLVVTGIAAALPLTASRAVEYVDVPAAADPALIASQPVPAAAPVVAAGTAAAVQPASSPSSVLASEPVARPAPNARAYTFHVAPGQHFTVAGTQLAVAAEPARAAPVATYKLTTDDGRNLTILGSAVAPSATYNLVSADGQRFVLNGATTPRQFEIRGNGETFVINGKVKRWGELTPAEKDRVRRAVAKARASLDRTHIDQQKLMRDVASIPDQARMAALQRELARTQGNIADSLHRIDERVARDRAAGRDPDQLEVALRATLQSVRAVDLQAAARALATVDQAKIAESIAHAEQSMQQARDELARIQIRMDADQHQ